MVEYKTLPYSNFSYFSSSLGGLFWLAEALSGISQYLPPEVDSEICLQWLISFVSRLELILKGFSQFSQRFVCCIGLAKHRTGVCRFITSCSKGMLNAALCRPTFPPPPIYYQRSLMAYKKKERNQKPIFCFCLLPLLHAWKCWAVMGKLRHSLNNKDFNNDFVRI